MAGSKSVNYFITGTDTHVGKTVAAAWLIQHLDGAYWKPVQSGLEDAIDADVIADLTGLQPADIHPSAYMLSEPLSPHEAARRDGVTISLDRFEIPVAKKPLVVEGAGGVLVPLNDSNLMVDLMAHLGVPVILVCRTALGTINHSLLSLEVLRARGIDVRGVILSGPPVAHNRDAIAHYGQVEIIAEIPQLDPLTQQAISRIPALVDLRISQACATSRTFGP